MKRRPMASDITDDQLDLIFRSADSVSEQVELLIELHQPEDRWGTRVISCKTCVREPFPCESAQLLQKIVRQLPLIRQMFTS